MWSHKIDMKFVRDLSAEDCRSDLWYSGREMKGFKHLAAWTIRRIVGSGEVTMAQYAEMNAEDTSAFLGLEAYLSPETNRNIFLRRRSIATAVLAEQLRQAARGARDPDGLAKASMAVSDVATKRARIVALIHADKREESDEVPS